MTKLFVLLTAIVSFSALTITAQQLEPITAVGLPQTEFSGSDIEHIDLMSGALQVKIPLIKLPGRGIDTDIELSYSSKLWTTVAATINYDDDITATTYFVQTNFGNSPAAMGNGWYLGFPNMGSLSDESVQPTESNFILYTETWTNNDGSNIGFTQSNGIFYAGVQSGCDPSEDCYAYPNCIMYNGSLCQIGPWWSYDNSYSWLAADDSVLIRRNGITATSAQVIKDTNGNQVTCSSFSCTDTLGRQFVASKNSAGMVDAISYVDSSGTNQTINITYTSYILDYPYTGDCPPNDGLVPGCVFGNEGTTYFPASVTLPGGASYRFEYFLNSDGSTTGELSKLTLPGGGYIRYNYGAGNSLNYTVFCVSNGWSPTLCKNQAENRVVTDRFVSSDGTAGSEQHWAYNIRQPYSLTDGPNAGAVSVASTVTRPSGDQYMDVFEDNGALSYSSGVPEAIPVILRSEIFDSSGTPLEIVDNSVGFDNSTYDVWDYAYGACCIYNNPRITSKTTTLKDSGQKSTTAYSYGDYGNITQTINYDWSSTGNDTILSRTVNAFLIDSTPTVYDAQSVHILDRLSSSTQYDSNANTCGGVATPCSYTTYGYDEFALQGTSNVVSHDYTNYSASSQSNRGNRTSQNRWLNTSGGFVSTYSHYDDLGNQIQTVDPMGRSTYYSYVDNFTNNIPAPQPTLAFVTTATLPAINGSHVHRYQYYFNSGKVAAYCGENYPAGSSCAQGLPATQQKPISDYKSFTYEALERPACLSLGDGGSSCFTYNDTSLPISITELTAESPANTTIGIVHTDTFDGLGRSWQSILSSDPGGSDIVTTGYDSVGRVSSVSNPYRSATDTTYGLTTTAYDALNRIVTKCNPDNGTTASCVPGSSYVKWSYLGNSTTVTDEDGNPTLSIHDSLGRLTKIVEPGSLVTTYSYNVQGDLVGANQLGNAANGDIARHRNFTYDSLSRLLCSSNPESSTAACPVVASGTYVLGTIGYGYDLNGNLQYKTDAGDITTTFTYDVLNRVTSKSFSTGSNFTPSSCYQYDSSNLATQATPPPNLSGRIANEWTQGGACSSSPPSTGVFTRKSVLAYDPMGRIKWSQQCVLTNCMSGTPFKLAQDYDLAGNMTRYTDGLDRMMLTQGFDTAGRLSAVISSWNDTLHPPNLFSVQGYDPAGGLQNWSLGNSLNLNRTYDPRLRVTSEIVTQP